MKRKHEMPFGAEILNPENVRFRIWAPNAANVDLRLSSDDRIFAMQSVGDGWFELTTGAHTGSQYQFRINGGQLVPDPASRFQPAGVHGASEVVDSAAYDWHDIDWQGRPWDDAVLYELHVGTFSPEGTFAGVESKLDYLASLGITAVELMPISSFPGKRNWGYDGVLPYAPTSVYGRPEDLKHLIDTAHSKNLMVFLDVVYNHFGPEGNYLWLYARPFFTDKHRTPWGQAINFDGPHSRVVRDYFIHNALYWLEEYHFDGLRFDAVHAIKDDSLPDILEEIATTVRDRLGSNRHVHLLLENDDNAAYYLAREGTGKPCFYTAQWNDDIHHAFHVLLTDENDGYYTDYSHPAKHLARCLAEGFSYQGEQSAYRGGCRRGERSKQLPPDVFVSFLQNHDQVGNRAFGDRIAKLASPAKLRCALAVLLLAPSPLLLFMGEEFAAETPFLFFCDFGPDLAPRVTEGRRAEFVRFAQYSSAEAQSHIPDPNSESTFLKSKLDWESLCRRPNRDWLEHYRELLDIRKREIVPVINQIIPGGAQFCMFSEKAFKVLWPLSNGALLALLANFADTEICIPELPQGRVLYANSEDWRDGSPPDSVVWLLSE